MRCQVVQTLIKAGKKKTCAVNDPLGQTHSPTSSDHYFHETFLFVLKIVYGRTDGNMCENNYYWVGHVDQKDKIILYPMLQQHFCKILVTFAFKFAIFLPISFELLSWDLISCANSIWLFSPFSFLTLF